VNVGSDLKGRKAIAYVLDDEPGIAAMVARALTQAGLDTRHFTEPVSCMTLARMRPPHLFVLDLSLGTTDAVEIIRQLEVLRFRGKVLLMSGQYPEMLRDIQRIGEKHGLTMLTSLQKPFKLADIHARLSEMNSAKIAGVVQQNGKIEATPKIRIELAEAFRKNWLELWYQPKISLRTLSVSGAEALIRVNHPDFGIVTPAQFLPPPGDPLYLPLTKFVLQRAMTDWRTLTGTGSHLKLSINIPAPILIASEIAAVLRKVLPADQNFPGLIVEVTESDAINDPDRLREAALQLRLYRIQISIDDFGLGYSSFERLTQLPFSEIKLNGSFVQGSASSDVKQRICRSAIELAHQFDATVCAEGVEQSEDLRAMIALGCDEAQGFLFAKPMVLEDFMKILSAKASPASAA
jgi:EAL domain-containing protein (putative c-di-GMP-specific phosphodiesterase class I)/ActR/RegA family two-component response regulator